MSDNLVPFKDLRPEIAEDAFVDPSARLMGRVIVSSGASVWAHAVVRGDDEPVFIGERAAVLENCLVEAPTGRPVNIGPGSLISHGAIVHGATVDDGALIGIGAIVLDSAIIGRGSIVAAGSVVTPGRRISPRQLVVGVPGKELREVTASEAERTAEEVAHLAAKAQIYRQTFAARE